MGSPIADTWGVTMIGVVLSGILYGITLGQTYIYFTHSAKDAWGLKTVVVTTLFLDTVHQALLIQGLWFYLIESATNPGNLILVDWSSIAQLFFSMLNPFVVQLFYAWRIRKLTHGWVVSATICVTAVVPLVFYTYYAISLSEAASLLNVPPNQWKIVIAIFFNVGSDILISGAMSYYLFTSKQGVKRTDTVLNKLILYTVSTGLLTTIFSFCTAVLVLTETQSLFSELLFFCIAKLYTNSLLASLNARERMQSLIYGKEYGSIKLPSTSISSGSRASGSDCRHRAVDTTLDIRHSHDDTNSATYKISADV